MARNPFRDYIAARIREARHDLRVTANASADRHTVNRLAFARATRAGLPNVAEAIDASGLRVTRTLAKLRPWDYGLTPAR